MPITTQNITSHLAYLFPHQPLTVKCVCGRPTGSVCVNTSTHREPPAFKQNTGYILRVGMVVGAGAGAGAGADASTGMLAKAVCKHQAEG